MDDLIAGRARRDLRRVGGAAARARRRGGERADLPHGGPSVRPDGPPPERTLAYECGSAVTAVSAARSTALDEWLFAPEPAGRVRAMRAAHRRRSSLLRLATGPYRGPGRAAGRALPAGVVPRAGWTRCRRSGCSSASRWSAASRRGAGGRSAGGSAAPSSWRGAACWCSPRCWASRGKVQHNDLPLLLVAAVLAAAPVGVRLDRRAARRRRGGGPCAPASLVVTGIYFLTGFQKVVASGPAWVLSDNLRNVMYAARSAARRPPTRCRCSSPTARCSPTSWRSSRWSSSSARSSCSCGPRLRPAFVVAAAVLHVGIYLTHGLDYSMWVGTPPSSSSTGDAVLRRVHRAPPRCTRRSLTRSRHPSTTSSTTRSRTADRGSPGGCSTIRSWWPPPSPPPTRPATTPRSLASFLALVDDAASRIIDHPIRPRIKVVAAGSAARRARRRQGGGARRCSPPGSCSTAS